MTEVVLLSAFAVLLACMISGCGTLMRDLQYSNTETGLFPSEMSLRFYGGKTDAAKLIAAQTYDGTIERTGIRVSYPAEMRPLAEHIADSFGRAASEVEARTGVTWAFTLDIYLVPVTDTSGGFRLKLPLRRSRILKIPLLVTPGPDPAILPWWSGGIGHEITEASMLAAISKRELILGDYCLDGAGLVNETRWFRDGVAEFGGDILNEALFGERYQPPPWIYRDLARAREGLLDWSNCQGMIGPYVYYGASHALVRELINRSGEDVVARIMEAASRDRYINGSTLRRAVRKTTSLDLEVFVMDYRPVWLGMDLRDSRPDGPLLVREGNEVTVSRVYKGSPADKWKLRPGDVILSADGKPVVSAAWLAHYVASREPRARMHIVFRRGGETISYRMMVTNRPPGD